MIISGLLSAGHIWAFGLGLGAVFMRGYFLKQIRANPTAVGQNLSRVFIADNLWGLAFVLWLATGLTRAFAGFEKGSEFYLQSTSFWVKMGLLLLILVLEIFPMITLIQWRVRRASPDFAISPTVLTKLIRLNTAETHTTLLIPIVAALMARGL